DQWVKKILDSVDTSNMKVIALMDTVSVVEEEIKEGMEEEEHDADSDHDSEPAGSEDSGTKENETEEPEYDEHVWTSPKNAVQITSGIMEGLCEVDPDNAEEYRANAAAYMDQLNKLDGTFKALVDGAVRKTIVFGDRFPFRYFADEYGLDYWAAFPGCSTETEPSAATVAFLTDKVKEEKIPVIFKIELSNGNIARSISEATGAKVLTLHSCHNLTKQDFENGETYLSLMEKNVDALKEALY
ncbi:MAG: transporter substrate-binding protein, partial [Bacillota bacterium]|nr:transporter substrate-binding protein [Bacillota bacterium]